VDVLQVRSVFNHLSVHLGEAALPRFGDEWLYGDLHYHSQGTDNEGEVGYSHRNVVRALGAMGIDWALASEHASDSEQIVDADIEIDIIAGEAVPVLRRGVQRDMSALRFRTLHDRVTGGGGVNREAARSASRWDRLPQSALSHRVFPQLFLGGEVDVITCSTSRRAAIAPRS
jgi:hypothetical protein